MGLARLGRRSVEKVTVDRRVLITVLLACLSFYVLIAPSRRPTRKPWDWGGQDAVDGARLDGRAVDLARRRGAGQLRRCSCCWPQRQVLYPLDPRPSARPRHGRGQDATRGRRRGHHRPPRPGPRRRRTTRGGLRGAVDARPGFDKCSPTTWACVVADPPTGAEPVLRRSSRVRRTDLRSWPCGRGQALGRRSRRRRPRRARPGRVGRGRVGEVEVAHATRWGSRARGSGRSRSRR